MNSKVSYASITLPYPIFAAEFDPYNRGYLVVGGGGGESRSGVPNQITVLDVYNRALLLDVADIELSRDEDSVQSLASLATKDGLITFAGVNSSQADQNAGKNEHFRAYDIKIPARKRVKLDEAQTQKGSATVIGKRSLFRPDTAQRKEAYQRILKLSPVKREGGARRIGAIASGLSHPAQVIVFNATTALPSETDIIARASVEKDDDVLDLDIAVADQDRFSVIWCTDHDIYEQTYDYDFTTKKTQKSPPGPRRVYRMATSEANSGSAARPRFRCIRFLDPQHILALVNLPESLGSELRIYHLYPTGPASTTFQMHLPSHIKQAVSMDVCSFDSDGNGNHQILVAVAGKDISITTWLVDYRAATETYSQFHRYQTARNVHKHQMTKICFAPFHPPQVQDKQKDRPEQYAKLASVSYGNSVVVDSFPLFQLNGKDPRSRYVLVKPHAHNMQRNIFLVVMAFVFVVMAYIGQVYIRGSSDISLPFKQFLGKTKQGLETGSSAISVAGKQLETSAASIVESSLPTAVPGQQALQELLDLHAEPGKTIVIQEGEDSLTLDVHHNKQEYLAANPQAKHWDELHEEQRTYWKRRLQQAGHWAESEGETVLKSVLWSQWAGLVGEAAGDILRGL